MSVETLSSNLALLGYALASVLYLVSVPKPAEGSEGGISQKPVGLAAGKGAFSLFLLATICVSVGLISELGDVSLAQVSGLLLTVAVGWLAVGGHLLFNLRLIGAFMAPLATLLLLSQIFLAPNPGTAPTLASLGASSPPGILVTVHVALAVMGQAFAIIACAVSIFYLWQQNLLKKKRLSQLPQNLPAIDRVEWLLRASLWTGFILLTLGLISGAVYCQLYEVPAELRLSAKVIWATVVWIWYLAILLAKNVFNRPSKRIAQMSLAGFLLLALSYFGIGFLRSGGG